LFFYFLQSNTFEVFTVQNKENVSLPGKVAVPAPLIELGRPAKAAGSTRLLCIIEGYLAAPSADNVDPLLALTL